MCIRDRYKEGQAMFVSEYGGIKWAPGSTDEKAWGYGNGPRTEEEYISRYKGLTDALLDNPRMFGFCYTPVSYTHLDVYKRQASTNTVRSPE